MLIEKEIEINGQKLRKTYSSKGFYILKVGTEEKYASAIDVPESDFVYIETDEISPYAEELAKRTLTGTDVQRALYRATNMNFKDLIKLIQERMPDIDIKGLAIEFEANQFYRGATFNNIPLFDTIGALLGYNEDDIDYLFENKQLPEKE